MNEISNNKYAVILAGGVGSRFWPLSRELEPKQFLKLKGNKSLLQQTVKRITPFIAPKNIYIVANCRHNFEIKRQVENFFIPEANIILEPEGKNTAPAIGLAARFIIKQDPDAIMFVFPSDHFISNNTSFLGVLKQAEILAGKDYLVTLGIPPTMPHTGYGYIKIQTIDHRPQTIDLKSKNRQAKYKAYRVEKFVEKPDRVKAEKYFKDKKYFWNSGMFIWKAKVILDEITAYLPELAAKLKKIDTADINEKTWKRIPAISLDYGILEKSKRTAVVAAKDIGWSDLGSWPALAELLAKDKNGNTIQADSIDIGSKNTAVFGEPRLIATIGLKDLIISDTPDALLVCDKSRAEEVKEIVRILKQNRRKEHSIHTKVKRPWGTYTVLNSGIGFKVKLVEVLPHKRLSLQRHIQRSEHWVVVEGEAKITNKKNTLYLNTNESTYIPKKGIHCLENPIDIPLKIIEVQCGKYLEEDDIQRLEDEYGRSAGK
ncbi:MAG: mannose-1-phosphate guanylyltransferase/mannose-6-phosphate isomerase [Candidatus Omnitrophica bacterium]|nr:mannose-1-phosphate guanylyltransferase/mannose-6-phosphate isomerase [Candidatus Omnitrophota bacterium]